ncbi:hypothetical protein EDC04DRAFT_447439 [Pisolithus marmoratus]|nr:hypothetical protein EDC04DRAFT_447439 [Pisolithus marmoratus]
MATYPRGRGFKARSRRHFRNCVRWMASPAMFHYHQNRSKHPRRLQIAADKRVSQFPDRSCPTNLLRVLTLKRLPIMHIVSSPSRSRTSTRSPKARWLLIVMCISRVDGKMAIAENVVSLLDTATVQTILPLSMASRIWHGMSKPSAGGILQRHKSKFYAKTLRHPREAHLRCLRSKNKLYIYGLCIKAAVVRRRTQC